MNNTITYEESAIEIERTTDFYTIAHQLSDELKGLPLSNEENDQLIDLMIKQVQEAECGAFVHGFKMGKKYGAYLNPVSLYRNGEQDEEK